MKSFRTEIHPKEAPFAFDHKSDIVTMGSCFAETIGQKLQQHRFNCAVNPFGITFHPSVLTRQTSRLIDGKKYSEHDLNKTGASYYSWDHHGRFNSEDRNLMLDTMNRALENGRKQLISSKVLIITWGTAWAYRHLVSETVVANCHKLPQDQFKKELVKSPKIIWDYKVLFEKLFYLNPDLQVILTVSPVRHWKDGAINNSRSKSILLESAFELVETFDNVHYFPSYELIMDDLRDYRFYKDDMLHPSDQAVDYVWNKFAGVYMNESTRNLNKRIHKLNTSQAHIGPKDDALLDFISKLESDINRDLA